MQTAVNVNADSEWDGVAQTIKKGLGKVQEEVEDVKKELNSKLDGVKNDMKSEMAKIKK